MLDGHTDCVSSVAYAPDGKHLVSGSGDDDQSVRLWDMLTGEQLKVFEGHTDYVSSVIFSPDGKHLVSASDDQSIRLWDASSGEELRLLDTSSCGAVSSVALSPDAKYLVSGSDDYSVRVWDFSNREGWDGIPETKSLILENPPNDTAAGSDSEDLLTHTLSGATDARNGVHFLQEETPQGRHTGWLVSPTDPCVYLMFVPLAENLPEVANILTLPTSHLPHIDMSKAAFGETWTHCYTTSL